MWLWPVNEMTDFVLHFFLILLACNRSYRTPKIVRKVSTYFNLEPRCEGIWVVKVYPHLLFLVLALRLSYSKH
jgi:hypothetical protein